MSNTLSLHDALPIYERRDARRLLIGTAGVDGLAKLLIGRLVPRPARRSAFRLHERDVVTPAVLRPADPLLP